MKKLLTVVALCVSFVAFAKEVSGVKLADTMSVDGKDLKLNGAGLRKKFVFKVYVAGLYLETPSKDASAVVSSDQTKRVEMRMLRDLEKGKIIEAIEAGFEKNVKSQLPALKDRLAKFTAEIPDLKEGQALTITYLPGKGTFVKGPDGKEASVEGKDFADALFSVWLGKNPVDDSLKQGMLGAE